MTTFRNHTTLIAFALVSIAGLAFVLVSDALRQTERALVEQSLLQCSRAAGELNRQLRERSAYGGEVSAMPLRAQDLALRGLTEVVLRSFEGVEGGYVHRSTNSVLGSGRDLTRDEHGLLRRAIEQGSAASSQGADVLIASAVPAGPGYVAWTFKRITNARDPAGAKKRWWLAALVVLAMSGVLGVVSVSMRLRSGVATIQQSLRRLTEDFAFRPPPARGEVGEILAGISDMADRRTQLEAELRRQDRLAALGTVVAGVAHEIRNPLNSMRLTLELLERKIAKGSATPAEVRGAVEQIDRLDHILQRLLSFGRSGVGERILQDLTPLLREAARLVEEQACQKGVAVRVRTSSARAPIDASQFQQVMLNLLLNAIQASPHNSCVEVEAKTKAGEIEVIVADSGPGIPPDARDHVFDAFYTTRSDGSGLGLSVSREIVAAHGGRIEFDCDAGGTRFRVVLPQTADAAARA